MNKRSFNEDDEEEEEEEEEIFSCASLKWRNVQQNSEPVSCIITPDTTNPQGKDMNLKRN